MSKLTSTTSTTISNRTISPYILDVNHNVTSDVSMIFVKKNSVVFGVDMKPFLKHHTDSFQEVTLRNARNEDSTVYEKARKWGKEEDYLFTSYNAKEKQFAGMANVYLTNLINIISLRAMNPYSFYDLHYDCEKPYEQERIHLRSWVNSGKHNDYRFYLDRDDRIFYIEGIMNLTEIGTIIVGYYDTQSKERVEFEFKSHVRWDASTQLRKQCTVSCLCQTWWLLMQAYGKYHGCSNAATQSPQPLDMKDSPVVLFKMEDSCPNFISDIFKFKEELPSVIVSCGYVWNV